MKIRDSVAFVTGANRGIRLAFAQALLAGGARKVYAAARQPERITAGVEPVRLDVTNPEDVAAGARHGQRFQGSRVVFDELAADRFARATQVVGVHAGQVDTDMARQLTLPKVTPLDVVRQARSAVEAGRDEVLADDMTRQVKGGLSDREGIYINFDPEHAVLAK